MKKLFSVRVPNLARSKLFLTSILLNSGGSGLVMAFLLVYFDRTTPIGLAAIGFAISLGRAVAMIVPLLIGRLLDIIGSRYVAALGDFITGIGFCICCLATDPLMIMLSQVFIQAGGHMFWTSNRGMVLLAAQGEKTQTWFGLIGALRNAGLGAGTLLSALAFSYNSAAVFHGVILAAAALYFLSCIVLFVWRPDGEKKIAAESDAAEADAESYSAILKNKTYLGLLLLNCGLVVSAMVIPLVIVIYVTQQIGLPAVFAGALVVLNTVLVALLGAHIAAWTQDIAPRRAIRAGYSLKLLSFFCFWGAALFAGRPLLAGGILIFAMLVYTAAEMIASPAVNVLSVDLAPAKGNGRYMALFQMTWSVGMTVTPALFGWLLSESESVTWFALAALVGAFGVWGFRLFSPGGRQENAG